MKNLDFFESTLSTVIKIGGPLIAIAYACGFLIWNIFLENLGFQSDSLVQGRYALSGLCFLFFSFAAYSVLEGPYLWIRKKISSEHHIALNAYAVIGVMIWLFLYSYTIFPLLPSELGGAAPRVVSFVGTPESLSFFTEVGISKVSDIQTRNLCIVYEDNEYILVLLSDRLLWLDKKLFYGFGSISHADPRIKLGRVECKNWLFSIGLMRLAPR